MLLRLDELSACLGDVTAGVTGSLITSWFDLLCLVVGTLFAFPH